MHSVFDILLFVSQMCYMKMNVTSYNTRGYTVEINEHKTLVKLVTITNYSVNQREWLLQTREFALEAWGWGV